MKLRRRTYVPVVVGCVICCLGAGCKAPASKEVGPASGGQAKPPLDRGLTMAVHLRRDERVGRNSFDVELTFANTSERLLKIPIIDGAKAGMFYDYVVLGDIGDQCITRCSGGWFDADLKQVRLVTLLPKGTHVVKLSGVQPFGDFQPLFEGEHFTLMVIYRDFEFGHAATYPEYGKNDPTVWAGMCLSSPVDIDWVSRREDEK